LDKRTRDLAFLIWNYHKLDHPLEKADAISDYLANYTHSALSPAEVVSIMVGDLQRIRDYPARGFQIEQEIPAEVMAAYDELVAKGFTQYLVQ
jgi:hypothetical protein